MEDIKNLISKKEKKIAEITLLIEKEKDLPQKEKLLDMKDDLINEKLQLIIILNEYFIKEKNEIKSIKRKTDKDPDTDEDMDIESEDLNYAVAKGIRGERKIKIIKKIKKKIKKVFKKN